MTITKNVVIHLEERLWEFGLDPSEWQLQFENTTATEPSLYTINMQNIKVVNLEDHDFFFKADAILERKNQKINVMWERLQLVAI